MRRANSWLARSEKCDSTGSPADTDCEKFIFLWIAFNAAYGRELIEDRSMEIMQADIDENPASEVWGKVAYPRVTNSRDPTPGIDGMGRKASIRNTRRRSE